MRFKTDHFIVLLQKMPAIFSLKAMGAGFAFLFQLEVARLLGAKGSGVIFIVLMIATLGSVVARLGMEQPLIRFVAESVAKKKWADVTALWGRALCVGLISSVAIAILVLVSGKFWSEGGDTITPFLTALILITMTLTILLSHALQGVGRLKLATSIERLFPMSVACLSLLLIYPFIEKASSAVLALSIGWLFSLIIGAVDWGRLNFTNKIRNEAYQLSEEKTRGFYSASRSMFVVSLFSQLSVWVGVGVVGTLLTIEEVGQFGVSQRVAMLVAFVLGSINTIVKPKFAQLNIDDDGKNEIEDWVRNSAVFMFLMAMPFFLVCFFFGDYIMLVFGDEYKAAAPILKIFSLSQMINCFFGPLGPVLTMTGHDRVVANAMVGLFVMTVVSSIFLVMAFGLIGAAIGPAISLLFWNIWMTTRVKKYLHFNSLPF